MSNVVEFDLATDEEMAAGGGGNWLQLDATDDNPHTFHVVCEGVENNPEKRDGSGRINGMVAKFTIMAASNMEHVSKTIELTFQPPNASHKDGGAMCSKKRTACLIALGLVEPNALGKATAIDLDQATGRQCILTVENGKANDSGKRYVQLRFSDIWHVDDPRAAKCERNKRCINAIPAGLRKNPDVFKSATDAKPTPAPAAAAATASKASKPAPVAAAPVAATATASANSLDDL